MRILPPVMQLRELREYIARREWEAEFEREMIRVRTLSGIRAAEAAGRIVGRPKRVFRVRKLSRLKSRFQIVEAFLPFRATHE
jgi:DNA invertase Pin-like site-specific DNA recombinase